MADDGTPDNGLGAVHAGHDAELIAALVDRDLPTADRVAGTVLAESCPDCRALLDDLSALAAMTAELPIPARAREFTLTPEIAARISAAPTGEPLVAAARLTGEMTVSTSGHEAHDRLLIASLVDRSISDTERARAEQQLAACTACAQLHQDLVDLAAATRAMPVPARPREYTLSPADAERLRVSGWRRLIAAIGSSRDAFSRPLAIGFTTLGLAGLLVATVPMPFGTGGAASTERQSTIGAAAEDSTAGSPSSQEFRAQASAAPAPSGPAIAATGPTPVPSAALEAAPAATPGEIPPDVLFEGGDTSPIPGEPDSSRDLYRSDFDAGGFVPSPLSIAAGLLLVLGLGLFGLRWTARHLGDG